MHRTLIKRFLILAAFAAVHGTTRNSAARAAELAGLSTSPALAKLTSWVNPFLGTGAPQVPQTLDNAGETFPGAVAPFGMIAWSPDTVAPSGHDNASGYKYAHREIQGFSLTHFSGRNRPYLQDFPLMPVLGAVTAAADSGQSWFHAGVEHRGERAEPGYIRQPLKNGIVVELTVSSRAGIGRIRFPDGHATSSILIRNLNLAQNTADSVISIDAKSRTISGQHRSRIAGNRTTEPYQIFFVAEFDRPFSAQGVWDHSALLADGDRSSSDDGGAYVSFDTTQNRVVGVRVGISYVSIANARLNLEQELAGEAAEFDGLRSRTLAAWNERLGIFQIKDNRPVDELTRYKVRFYTALYHAMIHPSLISDVNGQYPAFDRKEIVVNQIDRSRGDEHYTNITGWDAYRCQFPLLCLIAPREARNVVRSLIRDARDGAGDGPVVWPRWVQAASASMSMEGDPSSIFAAVAQAFGVLDRSTAEAALEISLTTANDPNARIVRKPAREGLQQYLERGYVATTDNNGDRSVSETLEYAIADYAISRFSSAIHPEDTKRSTQFLKRAQNWRNLVNSEIAWNPNVPGEKGLIKGRDLEGGFVTTTIHENGRSSSNVEPGYAEGSAYQYTWMVPHNLKALAQTLGGNARAIAKLDYHFETLNVGSNSDRAFMGNEFSLWTPYAYNGMGAPAKTQAVIRRIRNLYTGSSPAQAPDDATLAGLPGNDDGGALSAAYIFYAWGLCPSIPGEAGFTIGSPLFDSLQLKIPAGSEKSGALLRVTANADDHGDNRPFIQSATLNGAPFARLWLDFAALAPVHETTLNFVLGDSPSNWGSAATDAPPSLDPPSATPAAPSHLMARIKRTRTVELSWRDNALDEVGYAVERNHGDGPWTRIAELGVNSLHYSDLVANDGTYCYRVLATGAEASSPTSNSVTMIVDDNAVATARQQSLVAHWFFKEGTGIIASDRALKDRAALASSAHPRRRDGKFGSALTLTAGAEPDPVCFDGSPSLNLHTNEITLAAWVRFDAPSTSGASCILQKGIETVQYRLAMDDGRLIFYLGPDVGNVRSDPLSGLKGSWHHVAGSYDGGYCRLFLDGKLLAQSAGSAVLQPGSGYLQATSERLWIGGLGTGPERQAWDGALDDLRLYDRGLTESEIREVMLSAAP